MANVLLEATGKRYTYISIDTAPPVGGSWCSARSNSPEDNLFFSFSGGGTATATIQYKLPHVGAAWTDYLTTETLENGARLRIDDNGFGTQWRAGVKQGGFGANTVIIGLDW